MDNECRDCCHQHLQTIFESLSIESDEDHSDDHHFSGGEDSASIDSDVIDHVLDRYYMTVDDDHHNHSHDGDDPWLTDADDYCRSADEHDLEALEDMYSHRRRWWSTSITSLNEYCLMHLLSYLPFDDLMAMRSVSTQFMRAADDFLTAKRKLKLINSFAKQHINIETSKAVASDLVVITDDCRTDRILELMSRLCPQLEALEMIYVTVDEPVVDVLTKHFYDVKRLSFAHPLGLTEGNIKLIVQYFGAQLVGLSVADCELSEHCLQRIVDECQNLRSLDVSGNPDITGHCFENLNQNLQTLRLSQCESVREPGLQALVASECRQSLTELVISGTISDYMIRIVCESVPHLRAFQCVYGCTRELDSQQTDHLSVIGRLQRLEWLSLQEIDAYFGSLDDRSLYNIISCCGRLKYLELHIGSGEPLLVTDRSLSLIGSCCPLIECLKIYYFEALTDRTLNSFSKLKNLRELELINLYNITDEGVTIITEQCQQLSKLWISFDGNCDSITNLTLMACVTMCRKRPKTVIEVNFFETCITVPFNLNLPLNMRLRVSWYRPTPEGRRYTEIRLPNPDIDKQILATL